MWKIEIFFDDGSSTNRFFDSVTKCRELIKGSTKDGILASYNYDVTMGRHNYEVVYDFYPPSSIVKFIYGKIKRIKK